MNKNIKNREWCSKTPKILNQSYLPGILSSRSVRCPECGQKFNSVVSSRFEITEGDDVFYETIPAHKVSKAKATKKRPSKEHRNGRRI